MHRCLQLAKNGLGTTYPNPMVGCVLVHNDLIIGEGWHQKPGMPHAEVNAISRVKNHKLLREATLYVTLEPCSHFGKTPPCADLIISKKIKKVVIGTMDPNPKVAGHGIEKLEASGCEVILGILAEECEDLNKRFFCFHLKKRPYLILKWAETKDGFIAPLKPENVDENGLEKKPIWISNGFSRQIAHKMRAEEQAILVGTQTVLDDNPQLNTRHWAGKNPVRLILDRKLKIPKQAPIFNSVAQTIIFTEEEGLGAENISFEKIDFSRDIVRQICEILFKNQIQSVIVEGGAKTLQTFIDANLWDEAFVFMGNKTFGNGIKSPKFNGNPVSEERINDNVLCHYKNTFH